VLATLLLQLVVILAATKACGDVARRCGQTRVVGEIVAGVLLGPSVLGALAGDLSGRLFPAASVATLQRLSELGVVLFMFTVGLKLDLEHVRLKLRTAVAVSHFSILVPFALGAGSSTWLFAHERMPQTSAVALALFAGTAMSITAFPVLARIVDESSLRGTSLGAMALACAAVDDVTAWILLALVVTMVTSGGAAFVLGRMLLELAVFAAVMTYVLRPLLSAALRRSSPAATPSAGDTSLGLAVAMLAAFATETIGIHALFGAFVAGVIWPMDAARRRLMADRLEASTVGFLLPLFFAVTGLRTQIGLVSTASQWLLCLAIIGVATAGKLGGSAIAARATGLGWRDALQLGALMNARGLMELVALNIGYELQIVSPRLFTMMVLMALSTTMMTAPLVRRLGASVLGQETCAA
jgi:Kef-type K+ transport system membrane component KefB